MLPEIVRIADFAVAVPWGMLYGAGREKVFPGADEKTHSRAQYFSWINNSNEGSTEAHTLYKSGLLPMAPG